MRWHSFSHLQVFHFKKITISGLIDIFLHLYHCWVLIVCTPISISGLTRWRPEVNYEIWLRTPTYAKIIFKQNSRLCYIFNNFPHKLFVFSCQNNYFTSVLDTTYKSFALQTTENNVCSFDGKTAKTNVGVNILRLAVNVFIGLL